MLYRDTAIFSDLDGTLFNSDSVISHENLAAIRAYTEGGGLFAIATGRSFPNAVWYMKNFVPNAPSIVYNGSGVFDPETRRYLYQVEIDREAVLAVLLWCRDNLPEMETQVYGEQMTYYVTPRETATPELVEQLMPCEFRTVEQVRNIPWFKTLHYGEPDKTQALLKYLNESKLSERVEIVRAITGVPPYHEHIELLPKNVTKGTALDACRSIPCFHSRRLIAVGDYRNDRELLEASDDAFCPSNATDEIKAICERVLVSNDEHAIASLIFDVIPSL